MAWYDKVQQGSGNYVFPEWQLSGKDAIAKPGETIVVRFLPNPVVADFFAPDGTEIRNYEEEAPCPFVHANMHWYTTTTGFRRRALCTRALPDWVDQSVARDCQLCTAGVRIDRRMAVNAYVITRASGQVGKVITNESGTPEVRIMLISRRIFDDILTMMTGQFGVGDITHPFTGRHISMVRPANRYDRWRLMAQPEKTKLAVPHPLTFLRSIQSVESILNEAFKRQTLDSIDLAATLESQKDDGFVPKGHGQTGEETGGTNWF